MFGRSKKKREAAQTQRQSQAQGYQDYAAQFLPEETGILAVTGPAGMGEQPEGDSGLWRITIGLTAWMDEYERELHREDVRLEALVDEERLEYLRGRVPRNFLISVPVRPSGDGTRFLMTDLPKPGFDPELQALAEEQKKPVKLEAEGLGTLTLNRVLNWFEGDVDWLDGRISLTFDNNEQTLSAAQDTARALLDAQEDWNSRICAFAAGRLLEQINERARESGEPFTREELLSCLEAEAVLTGPEGAFEFWLRAGELPDCSVHVTGTLRRSAVQAELED